jgi:hypothetical protein
VKGISEASPHGIAAYSMEQASMVLEIFYLTSEGVLLKKNASENERAWTFDEVKRSEVERQAAVSSPGKLTAVFRSSIPERNLGEKIDRVPDKWLVFPFVQIEY